MFTIMHTTVNDNIFCDGPRMHICKVKKRHALTEHELTC